MAMGGKRRSLLANAIESLGPPTPATPLPSQSLTSASRIWL
jgi:hypothetical protein